MAGWAIDYITQTTRAGKHPRRFLAGFKGYLHVDGYAGYNELHVTLVGCWAHTRRKFDEALKALPEDKRNAPVAAREGLEYCNRLFTTAASAPSSPSSLAARTGCLPTPRGVLKPVPLPTAS
nr:transposase [Moorella mulderi]